MHGALKIHEQGEDSIVCRAVQVRRGKSGVLKGRSRLRGKGLIGRQMCTSSQGEQVGVAAFIDRMTGELNQVDATGGSDGELA
ncbi:hypothetical protein V6N12_028768 [Hibiscus sabdariffa]|uniref:Uncharacterized protein n=1 Tax=Hibiscus sabdariffa TaxID=183260 RepID=A0ABR2F6R6_9ROSI